jgi:hypothetical protein
MSLIYEAHKVAQAAKAPVDAAYRKDSGDGTAIEQINARLDRMALLCRALWSFVSEEHGVTEEMLVARVESLTPSSAPMCGECGRPLAVRQPKCLYCSAARPEASLFDRV